MALLSTFAAHIRFRCLVVVYHTPHNNNNELASDALRSSSGGSLILQLAPVQLRDPSVWPYLAPGVTYAQHNPLGADDLEAVTDDVAC
jgi:hypothetical protein